MIEIGKLQAMVDWLSQKQDQLSIRLEIIAMETSDKQDHTTSPLEGATHELAE